MKHMAFGKVALLGVFAVAGCYSYASEAINNGDYNTVRASPEFATVKVGDSTQVIVRLVNDADNGAITNYTVSEVGAGVVVHQNLKYRPVFDSKLDTLVNSGDKVAQQFYVVGLAVGRYTFKLTPTSVNTGVSTTVTIIVTPIDLGPALSKTTGLAPGDTVVITAPPNTVFTSTSAVSFTSGPAPAIVARAADSSSITILVAPGDSGAVTVTLVGQPLNIPAGTTTLVSTNSISLVPAVTVAPTTVSSTTPLIGVPITVTLGNNLRFLGNSHVFIGGVEAGLTAVSADSSTGTVTPLAFSTGPLTYTNIALKFLTSVPLSIPSDKSVTVGATYGGPTDANAGAFATATTYTLRKSLVVSDNGPMTGPCPGNLGGGNTCRYYKVTVAAGSTQGRIVWNAATSTDLGVYTLNAAGTSAATAIADDGAADLGTTGDSSAPATLTAGTIGFVVMNFGPAASVPWFQWRIVQQ